mgnify:CR=1 FL=1
MRIRLMLIATLFTCTGALAEEGGAQGADIERRRAAAGGEAQSRGGARRLDRGAHLLDELAGIGHIHTACLGADSTERVGRRPDPVHGNTRMANRPPHRAL